MKIFDRARRHKTSFSEENLLGLLEEIEYNNAIIEAKQATLAFTKPFKTDYFLSVEESVPKATLSNTKDIKEDSDENLSNWLTVTYAHMILINPEIAELNRFGYDRFVNEARQDFVAWSTYSKVIRKNLPILFWLIKLKLYKIDPQKYSHPGQMPGDVQLDIIREANIYELQSIIGQDGLDFVDLIIKRDKLIESCKLYDAKGFDIVVDYFNEARRCFLTGNYRASAIMSIASLEGCLHEDYYRRSGTKFKETKQFKSIFTFYLNQNLISNRYTSLVDIHKRMRNNIVHHNTAPIAFTEQSAKENLEAVKDVINSILVQHQ